MEEEKEGIKYKVYPGPKKPFKIGISIILYLSFIFGLVLLRSRPRPTGYVILGEIAVNWVGLVFILLGLVLVVIPLILVLFWLKKRH